MSDKNTYAKARRLESLFIIKNAKQKQLPSSEYKTIGEFPVVDQSTTFISAYSNQVELVYTDVPVIVFGDHTLAVKYIDFPFIVGGDGVQILKPVSNIEYLYLYYLILDAAIQIGNQGYERHLKYLKEFLVVFEPDRTAQDRVVQALSGIDRQIEQAKEMIAKHQTLKHGMLYDLFAYGIDIANMKLRSNEKTTVLRYKDSVVGKIPIEWECVQLKNLVKDIIDNRGKTPPTVAGYGIELIETAAIGGVELYYTPSKVTKFITQAVFDNCFRTYLEKNDILVSTVGEYAGSTAIFNSSKAAIAQNLIGLRILPEYFAFYVYYWSKSFGFKKQVQQVMMSSAQPSLNVSHLLSFYLPLPSLIEQKLIAKKLYSVYKLIIIEKNNLSKLRQIKQGLMSDLLHVRK